MPELRPFRSLSIAKEKRSARYGVAYLFRAVTIANILPLQAAPKIGESNIGFRMLASMGWAEGDRIGLRATALIWTILPDIVQDLSKAFT